MAKRKNEQQPVAVRIEIGSYDVAGDWRIDRAYTTPIASVRTQTWDGFRNHLLGAPAWRDAFEAYGIIEMFEMLQHGIKARFIPLFKEAVAIAA